jgi:formylglycine-generating enzyme required for sulfatase activity
MQRTGDTHDTPQYIFKCGDKIHHGFTLFAVFVVSVIGGCGVLQFRQNVPSGSIGPQAMTDLIPARQAQSAVQVNLARGSRPAQQNQVRAAERLGLSLEVKTRVTDIPMRLVPAGTFTMGSPPDEYARHDAEEQHRVTLTSPFYCGIHEVTQGQWQQIMGTNPSHFSVAGPNAPVEQVSWDDCQEFLTKLCQVEGVSSGTYRFLTEAEWEYACRAGTSTPFCYGDDLDNGMANFCGQFPYGDGHRVSEYRETTVPVGSFKPNAWGLYDMHGNVWEWCRDQRGDYSSGSVTDPLLSGSSRSRICRGGSWDASGWECRSAYRTHHCIRGRKRGLRIARTLPKQDLQAG